MDLSVAAVLDIKVVHSVFSEECLQLIKAL